MTQLSTPSPEELAQRRKSLRNQRRLRNFQAVWRVLAISGLAAGAIWLIRNPTWLLLQGPDQVVLDGNEMLSDAAIHDMLALEYPQPIFKIQPQAVVQRLSTQSPVAFARVNRQLFPPQLTIALQERHPVAVTIPSRPSADTRRDPVPTTHAGFLDAEGYWMAQTAAAGFDQTFELPSLRVRGFHPRYQSEWPTLYRALATSVVKVHEVDWRSPNNLILRTDVGIVHLGPYGPQRLADQLAMLPKFQTLSTDPEVPAVDYIDLANPQVPALKLTQPLPPNTEAETTP